MLQCTDMCTCDSDCTVTAAPSPQYFCNIFGFSGHLAQIPCMLQKYPQERGTRFFPLLHCSCSALTCVHVTAESQQHPPHSIFVTFGDVSQIPCMLQKYPQEKGHTVFFFASGKTEPRSPHTGPAVPRTPGPHYLPRSTREHPQHLARKITSADGTAALTTAAHLSTPPICISPATRQPP